jgi:arsenate reductase-like glutaredoxin family protein
MGKPPSRDEIERMLKRLEASEATISQQDATIKEMQMDTSH